MAIKSKAELRTQNDNLITSNNNQEITGPILNGHLLDIIDSFLSEATPFSLNNLTDVTTVGALEGYVIKYSGGTWVAQADEVGSNYYLTSVTGNGNFSAVTFTVNGRPDIVWDTTHVHDDRYYTKTEIDSTIGNLDDRFVDVTGDTMTGDLIISGANLLVDGTITVNSSLTFLEDVYTADGRWIIGSKDGYYNNIIGYGAGEMVYDGGGDNNIFFGNFAGQEAEYPYNLIAIGLDAGRYSNAYDSVFLGNNAGSNTTDSSYDNIFIGDSAGENADEPYSVIAIGNSAGQNTDSYEDVLIGYSAGQNLDADSTRNVVIGYNACQSAGDTQYSIYIGDGAGKSVFGNSYNVGIGYNVLTNNEYSGNVAIGRWAGESAINSDNSIMIGKGANRSGSGGFGNVLVGGNSGDQLTGDENTFIGNDTGTNATSASRNVFIGEEAAQSCIDGLENVVIGVDSDIAENCNYNTVIGSFATIIGTNSTNNVLVGRDIKGISGNYSTFLGNEAGRNSGSDYSLFLGNEAGYNDSTDNVLHIANNSASTLIYGEFDNKLVKIDGSLIVTGGTFQLTYGTTVNSIQNCTGMTTPSNTLLTEEAILACIGGQVGQFVDIAGDTMTGELIINSAQALTTSGDVTILGDLTVSGTKTYLNSTDLNISDNIITVNSGETGSGVSNLAAGIKVDRGTSDPYYFVFDELSDTFRVGSSTATETPEIVISGDTQAVATREDNPIDNALTYWDDTNKQFVTDSELTYNGSTNTITLNGQTITSSKISNWDDTDHTNLTNLNSTSYRHITQSEYNVLEDLVSNVPTNYIPYRTSGGYNESLLQTDGDSISVNVPPVASRQMYVVTPDKRTALRLDTNITNSDKQVLEVQGGNVNSGYTCYAVVAAMGTYADTYMSNETGVYHGAVFQEEGNTATSHGAFIVLNQDTTDAIDGDLNGYTVTANRFSTNMTGDIVGFKFDLDYLPFGDAYSSSANKYGLQIKDSTEGIGKYLKCVTSDGKAQWSDLPPSSKSIVKLYEGIFTQTGVKVTDDKYIIPFDLDVIKDDYFSHTTGTGEANGTIEILESGWYEIFAMLTVKTDSSSLGTRGNPILIFDINTGGTWEEQPDKSGGYIREDGNNDLSCNIVGSGFFYFNSGEKFRIAVKDTVTSHPDESIVPYATRLTCKFIDRTSATGVTFDNIKDIGDVTANAPNDKDLLVFNNSNSKWEAGSYDITNVDATANRLFYSNGSGTITELALGSSGTYLKSNGTTSAPTWDTPSGGGGAASGATIVGTITDSIGANTNNYNPTGLSTSGVIFLTATGSDRNLSGVVGQVDGFILTIINAGSSNAIAIQHNSGSSSVGNKFDLGDATEYFMGGGSSITFVYNGGSSVWTELSRNSL